MCNAVQHMGDAEHSDKAFGQDARRNENQDGIPCTPSPEVKSALHVFLLYNLVKDAVMLGKLYGI